MWSCCGVEREAKAFKAERSRGVPTGTGRKQERIETEPFNGNGKNIGLGFVEQLKRSEQPRSGDEQGLNSEVPLAFEGPDGFGAVRPMGVSEAPSETSPKGMMDSEGDNGKGLKEGGDEARKQLKKAQSFGMKIRKSRSSRLLVEGEDPGDDEEEEKILDIVRSPLQRRPTVNSIMSHVKSVNEAEEKEEAEGPKPTSPRSMMQSVRAKIPKVLGGSKASSSSSTKSGMEGKRRNSQASFSQSCQTAIIFDWDDTLFPTSYLIDDLRLNHRKSMKDQRISRRLHDEVSSGLKELENCALMLINTAYSLGRVILVTLARPPWVEQSCRCFYPAVGELIRQLRIKVVYAQEGVTVDYNRRRMMSDEEMERVYADMKGKAIAREVRAFYSQYEGQSWKNIISIGDSDFERIGTMRMSQQYMKDVGMVQGNDLNQLLMQKVATGDAMLRNQNTVDLSGHAFKVRTKTFKMLEYPTIGELSEELTLLQAWIPKMVALDDGFDADLNNLEDPNLIDTIEDVLAAKNHEPRGRAPV